MATVRSSSVWLGVIGSALVLSTASMASTVLAPASFALFIIALLWPLQKRLERLVPRLLALAISVSSLVVAFTGFALLIAFSVGRVGRWVTLNVDRFQAIYDRIIGQLEEYGIAPAGLIEHFNVGFFIGIVQRFTGQVNTTLSFWLIVLAYVILGLLEVEGSARKIEALPNKDVARVLLDGGAETAERLRKYMLIRTLMSVLTGALVWIFASAIGLQFAREWGIIAFALNYIPFIGPLIATLFPTLFAMVQFDGWQPVVVVFACLNLIQFMVGCSIEPRVSSNALAMSPFVVLFAVFLWTYMWGIAGTFIGVPIVVAVITFCAHHPAARWLAILLGPPIEPVRESA